ncbi:hypothetical protein HZD82_22320, partial [Pantoea agglomerans]|uniref:hypothetical protein n=1 Tax=Enterobacter agglomerans TaxID=549 RepID=UPI001A8C6278
MLPFRLQPAAVLVSAAARRLAVWPRWQVGSGKAQARPIYDTAAKKSLAAEDSALVKVLADDHRATREFV